MDTNNSLSQDAILGGNRPAPRTSLVLGGLAGLHQQFNTGDRLAQLEALSAAVSFGDEAIALLSQGLSSELLPVRAAAYELLQQLGSEAAIAAAGLGIPLKIGDRIYAVYLSSVSYGDDFYYIDSSIDEYYSEDYPIYKTVKDNVGQEFFCITEAPATAYDDPTYAYDDNPKLLKFFLGRIEADALAEESYKKAFFSLDGEMGRLDRNDAEEVDLEEWCDRHGVEFSHRENEEYWDTETRYTLR
jgi:hypothetical protein